MRYAPALIPALLATLSAQTSTWTKLSLSSVPPARAHHLMVYDSTRERVVLFGGWLGVKNGKSIPANDLWEFDGSKWNKLNQPVRSPSPRWEAGGAYDPMRKVLVLHGGKDAIGTLVDTWEWDGKTWVNVTVSRGGPGQMDEAQMFFDPRLGKVVLWGDGGQASTSNTWTWDGSSWAKLLQTGSPTPRSGTDTAYDTHRKRAVLFGGVKGISNLADTWAWNGSAWTDLKLQGPPARNWPEVAFDEASSQVVLFGGHINDFSPPLSDTWLLTGNSWSRLSPTASPPARWAPGMVYDKNRGQILLFGGRVGLGTTPPLDDTWVLDRGPKAAFTVFGKGCASTTNLPSVSSPAPPKLGESFTIDIKGFLPRAQIGQLIFGASDTKWGLLQLPLSLAIINMSNCTLWVSMDVISVIITDTQGNFRTTFQVPRDVSLLGTVVFGQATAPDPTANALGLATTNAFKAVVGF